MAKSTYYFELNKIDAVAEKNGVLLSEIKKIFHENKGRYGVRRIYQELCRRGHVVNHKRDILLLVTTTVIEVGVDMPIEDRKSSCRERV